MAPDSSLLERQNNHEGNSGKRAIISVWSVSLAFTLLFYITMVVTLVSIRNSVPPPRENCVPPPPSPYDPKNLNKVVFVAEIPVECIVKSCYSPSRGGPCEFLSVPEDDAYIEFFSVEEKMKCIGSQPNIMTARTVRHWR